MPHKIPYSTVSAPPPKSTAMAELAMPLATANFNLAAIAKALIKLVA